MGDARRRGTYAERKAAASPRVVDDSPRLALVYAAVDYALVPDPRGPEHPPLARESRAKPGTQTDRRGRRYVWDGVRLKRID